MRLRVLLRNTEVDVEQEEVPGRCGLGRLTRQHLPEPIDGDELLVLRQLLDGERLVGCPGSEAARVDARARDAEPLERARDGRSVVRIVAVHHDLAIGGDALPGEQPRDLRLVDGGEPVGRQRGGARDVPATRFAAKSPAVVRRERPDVEDRERRVVEAIPQLCGIDGSGGRGHEGLLARDGPDTKKTPAASAGVRGFRAGVRPTWKDARLATPPALLGSRMTHDVVVRGVVGHRWRAFSTTRRCHATGNPVRHDVRTVANRSRFHATTSRWIPRWSRSGDSVRHDATRTTPKTTSGQRLAPKSPVISRAAPRMTGPVEERM